MDGGIFGLLGLIRDHRGAVEYDWRARFGVGLAVIGDSMPVTEAARLAVILRHDPSSGIAAAVEGWKHPVSREALVLMDMFDVTMAQAHAGAKGPRPKPHPGRPWESVDADVRRMGNTGGRSRDQVVEILRAHGHTGLPV